jgi:hypothetical protein
MGAGWGNCDVDVRDKYDKFSCYCNAGPCGGKQCGDPVKIDRVTGKGTKCPVSVISFSTSQFAVIRSGSNVGKITKSRGDLKTLGSEDTFMERLFRTSVHPLSFRS